MTFPETVERVLALARAAHEYWERELPKRLPSYPLMYPGESEGPPPPEEAELRDLLATLPEGQVYGLALLAEFGRGFTASDEGFPAMLAEVRAQYGPPRLARNFLVSNSALDWDLEDALERLKRDGTDLDAVAAVLPGAGNGRKRRGGPAPRPAKPRTRRPGPAA